MIETYRIIGKIVKERDGYDKLTPAEKKRYLILQYCSDLEMYTKTDKQGITKLGRLLVLDLNTKTKKCSFSQGEQLNPKEFDKIMLFFKKASGDPLIYPVTNALPGILRFELPICLKGYFPEVKWSDKHQAAQFMDYMLRIKDIFFQDTGYGLILKKSALIDDQQDKFPDPINDKAYATITKKKDYSALINDHITSYVSTTLNQLFDSNQGYALKIDGQFLHAGIYASPFIEFMHYYLIEQNYVPAKQKGVCHICYKEMALGEKVSLKQKFYGTTNNLFFDGLKNNRTYTQFGMCADCESDITIGTNEVMNKLRFFTLDISSNIIPTVSMINLKDTELIEHDKVAMIEKLLSSRVAKSGDIDSMIGVLRLLQRKTGSFNILLYNTDPVKKDFKIIGFIRDASLKDLIDKSADLDQMLQQWQLYAVGNGINLSLKGLRMLVIPSRRSHKIRSDGEYNAVGRKIALLIETYMKNRKFDFQELIRSFVDIWARIEYDNQVTYLDHELAALIMQLYLLHLNRFNQIKGVRSMEQNMMTTCLDTEKHGGFLEYFEVNHYVFEKNKYYRGLFILGALISDIETAEYKKTHKSTFSNRLNYRGISTRKVMALYDLVEEYIKIKEVYDDVQLRAYCLEALLGIEKSTLMPEEVVFYLLAGKSFRTYEKINYSKQHNDQEETNDQQ